MDLQKINIGYKIRKVREHKNLSQKNVASEMGLTQSAYCKIEQGESEITYNKLERLSNIFGVRPEDIINYNENQIYNISNNVNGGNVFGQNTYHVSDKERQLYEDQIQMLKDEIDYLRKLLEEVLSK